MAKIVQANPGKVRKYVEKKEIKYLFYTKKK